MENPVLSLLLASTVCDPRESSHVTVSGQKNSTLGQTQHNLVFSVEPWHFLHLPHVPPLAEGEFGTINPSNPLFSHGQMQGQPAKSIVTSLPPREYLLSGEQKEMQAVLESTTSPSQLLSL